VSQNPLDALRRKTRPTPSEYPDPLYAELALEPRAAGPLAELRPALREVWLAHAVQLAEQRILDGAAATQALAAAADADGPEPPIADLGLGTAREELLAGAIRMTLRAALLDYAEQTLALRAALARLAGAHLTTTVLATNNGQTVQPTTFGHYFAAQLAPLARTGQRLHEAYARLNRAPLGAGAGMSSAMPLRRERMATLLGFDGPLENTFDALAADDTLAELLALVALAAGEQARLVNDLSYWARDEVGILTPGPEFVQRDLDQPQRRDPQVLAVLRVRCAEHVAAFGAGAPLLIGRAQLGDDATRLALFTRVEQTLRAATDTCRLLARVLETAEVNRALAAARANRGFATSSELADLLTVDHKLPPADARRIAEQVVVEALEASREINTLKPEHVDSVALREIGRELGIEPEMLSRCLAPKRFLERRATLGGPAPNAVRAALDRETLTARKDAAWLRERREALAATQAALAARRDEILAEPSSAWQRRPSASAAEVE
jgi:argininosuccinate lyase